MLYMDVRYRPYRPAWFYPPESRLGLESPPFTFELREKDRKNASLHRPRRWWVLGRSSERANTTWPRTPRVARVARARANGACTTRARNGRKGQLKSWQGPKTKSLVAAPCDDLYFGSSLQGPSAWCMKNRGQSLGRCAAG